jgi:antitoxin ParD1/3/4
MEHGAASGPAPHPGREGFHRPALALARLAIATSVQFMSTMNVSLPDELKAFVDRQVSTRGYASSSEYVRELLRREQDREKLRELLLEGLESGPGREADADYFAGLRERIDRRAGKQAGPRGSTPGVPEPEKKSSRATRVQGGRRAAPRHIK